VMLSIWAPPVMTATAPSDSPPQEASSPIAS
jgi:hypothetical protein